MTKRIAVLLICVLASVVLYAQATKIISSGTLPHECTNGAIYWKTGSSKGLYGCDAGTWQGPYITSASGGGTVTNTGTLTSGKVIIGNGSSDITVASTTGIANLASGTLSAATDGSDYLSPATGATRLAQVVTASSQSTVVFSSISASYSSLMIVFESQDTTSGTNGSSVYLKMNTDGTSGNYTSNNRLGVQNGAIGGLTQLAATSNGMYIFEQPNTGNTGIAASGTVILPSYARTTFHKQAISTWRAEWNGNLELYLMAARWKSTSAINQLTFTAATAFTDGSVFTLYGLP